MSDSDRYFGTTRAIEAVLREYFGGLTHRFVIVATGIDENGGLREKVFVPEGQLYSDSIGQIEYARMVLDLETRAHYLGQKWINGEAEE